MTKRLPIGTYVLVRDPGCYEWVLPPERRTVPVSTSILRQLVAETIEAEWARRVAAQATDSPERHTAAFAAAVTARIAEEFGWHGPQLKAPGERYAIVRGYSLSGDKYEVGTRYGGWNEWLFTEGTTYKFMAWCTEVTKAEATRVPERLEA